MKIILNDIGKIRKANVDLSTIAIIAGENNSGKSTVGKILYSIYKAIKNKKDIGKKLLDDFDSLIRFGTKDGYIEIIGYINCRISASNDIKISCSMKNNNDLNMIYIDDPNILDLPVEKSFLKEILSEARFDILEMIKNKNENKIIVKDINEIVSGNLEIKNNHFYYTDNKNIKMKNTSSGLKMFLILKTILENGWIKENSILIFDEPEVHLHPEWQIKFSNIIVDLAHKYNTKILLNTHSPYLVNAVEVFGALKNQNARFYLTKNSENYADILDVTEDIDLIYKELAEPFGKLENISYE